jgi:Uma2 family endonuclease
MNWAEVLADRSLDDLPYKIELNEFGQIIMTPVKFIHSVLQGAIVAQLASLTGGRVIGECSVQTSKGVRVPDAAWASHEFVDTHLNVQEALPKAPDICVEVKSPSNSVRALQEKVALFLEAGAKEVWLVHESGSIEFYDATGQIVQSRLAGAVPNLLGRH